MNNKNLTFIQILGVIGFLLAIFGFQWGWFVGFLCTGIFFLFRKTNKQKLLNYTAGVVAVLYSFYYMFSFII
ncbi:hypothetical protein [Bacillus sp. AK031]